MRLEYLQHKYIRTKFQQIKRSDFVLITEGDLFTQLTIVTGTDPHYDRICPKITLWGHD